MLRLLLLWKQVIEEKESKASNQWRICLRIWEFNARIGPFESIQKDVKKAQKQTFPKRNMEELKNVMNLLAEDKQLSPEKRDHLLGGAWVGYRECHVQPDFLLIYKKNDENDSIRFERLGTHSELFR
jgi:mRNA interferase YafQ